MMVSDIQLFQILKQKLGEKEAETLVEFVDQRLKESNETNLKIVATKEDIANLKSEMERRFTEQMKWMIVMWVTQLGAIIAILEFFFRK